MTRFILNRRWTCILALGVILVYCPVAHRPVLAGEDPGTGQVNDPDQGPGGGNGSGDPDVPIGPAKTGKSGRLSRNGTGPGTRAAGDGSVSRSVWVWRLRVVMLGLRSFYIRF